MKTINNKKISIKESQIKHKGDEKKLVRYADLIEITLDIIPQGGFSPKDIKERNRIQEALDKATAKEITFEDADYTALKTIVANSRWTIRSKEINTFLSSFD